jgi:hypothetical protein
MVEYRPLELPSRAVAAVAAGTVGARPMAGRLTLDQPIGVRLLCPQL